MAPETASYCIVVDFRREHDGLHCRVTRWDSSDLQVIRVSWVAERSQDAAYRSAAGGVAYVAAPPGAPKPAQYIGRPIEVSATDAICWTESGLDPGAPLVFIAVLPSSEGFHQRIVGPWPNQAKIFEERLALLWRTDVESSGKFKACWKVCSSSNKDLRAQMRGINDRDLGIDYADLGDIPNEDRPQWEGSQQEPEKKVPPAVDVEGWSLEPGP